MEVFKNGMRVRLKTPSERKATGEVPDILMKPVKREDRKNLPPKVKVVFFCLEQQGFVSEKIYHDCLNSHPEYFETVNKK